MTKAQKQMEELNMYKKLISLSLAVLLTLSMVLTANAQSQTIPLSSGSTTMVSCYLEKNEKVTITVSQNSPYATNKTSDVTRIIAGGEKTKVAVSAYYNNKNKLYKKCTLTSKWRKNSKSYTFKATKTGTYHFYLTNITKVPRKETVTFVPEYTLSVNK